MKKIILLLIFVVFLSFGFSSCMVPFDEEIQNTTVSGKVRDPYIYQCDAATDSIHLVLEGGTKKYKIFQIDIATDSEFTNIVSTDLYDFDIDVIPNLVQNTDYYVRIRGFDGTSYSNYSETTYVKTLAVQVDSLNVDQKQLYLYVGDQYQLNVTVLPDNVFDKSIVWSSTNEEVVNVSQDGTVTAVGVGNAAVIMTASNEVRTACAIHVSKDNTYGVTEKLVLDKSTLNGNAVFGRYASAVNRSAEQNVSFDDIYKLRSFDSGNTLIESRYYFGGIYSDVNADGIPFSYTWTENSGYDFDGNDCLLVNDSNPTQTLGFVGGGAYEKLYLLSLADDYDWSKFNSRWFLGYGDVWANVTLNYQDGTNEVKKINFKNMLNLDESLPYCDAYTLSTITYNPLFLYDIGDAGCEPYMYAIPVDCNPNKQISSVTISVINGSDVRKVNLAVFAVSGKVSESAPSSIDESKVSITNVSEYGFNLSWEEVENADGYYFSIFNDSECRSVSYVNVFNTKVYLSQAILLSNSCGFKNESYNPGQTYYVKVAAFNEYGSSVATVIPVTTIGTYPKEVRLNKKDVDLSIGESIQLSYYFPTNSYYTFSDVVWSVSDSDVLRINNGKVTGIAPGEATVRVSLAKYPEIYAECTVIVDSYGDGWIGYDDGIFADNDTCLIVSKKFIVDVFYGAIVITADQLADDNVLDMFEYYVSSSDTVKYEIYLVDSGSTPFNQKPIASGTISSTVTGWVTVKLNERVEVLEGKEVWIAVKSSFISRSDNISDNGSYAKIDGRWVHLSTYDITGSVMIRAHFSKFVD